MGVTQGGAKLLPRQAVKLKCEGRRKLGEEVQIKQLSMDLCRIMNLCVSHKYNNFSQSIVFNLELSILCKIKFNEEKLSWARNTQAVAIEHIEMIRIFEVGKPL